MSASTVGVNAALIVTGGMTMNREKLEQKLEACMMDFSQNPPLDDGLLLSKTKVLDLIDTATREARIEMLKNMKKSLMVARVNPGLKPLQLPEDARIQQMIADEFDRNIAELNQSNTKRNK